MFRVMLFLMLASVMVACASPSARPQVNHNAGTYYIRVKPITPALISHSSFKVSLKFEVYSPIRLMQNALVQEIRQVVTYERKDGQDILYRLQLVEAFKLRATGITENGLFRYDIIEGQTDTHRMSGLWENDNSITAVRVNREVFAYVGSVYGADFTDLGFAMLPGNEAGDMKTAVSRHFNKTYQLTHEIRGGVKRSGDHLGVAYRLQYRVTKDDPKNPYFQLDRARGRGLVEDTVQQFWRGD